MLTYNFAPGCFLTRMGPLAPRLRFQADPVFFLLNSQEIFEVKACKTVASILEMS
jgi:hypothetical protein